MLQTARPHRLPVPQVQLRPMVWRVTIGTFPRWFSKPWSNSRGSQRPTEMKVTQHCACERPLLTQASDAVARKGQCWLRGSLPRAWLQEPGRWRPRLQAQPTSAPDAWEAFLISAIFLFLFPYFLNNPGKHMPVSPNIPPLLRQPCNTDPAPQRLGLCVLGITKN